MPLHRINTILHQILGKELDSKIKSYFLSGAYKSILAQAAITLLTFFIALFIARVTGDKGFGVYTTVFNWIGIISVVAVLGLDDLILKQLPIYNSNNEQAKTNGLLIWANKTGLIGGILGAGGLLILAYCTPIHGLCEYKTHYLWAVWAIPLFVFMHIYQATLRASKMLGWGQFAEKVVQPMAFFFLLLLFYFLQNWQLTDYDAIITRTISFVVTALCALFLVKKYLPENTAEIPQYEISKWWGNCQYFAMTTLLYALNTRIDILFLGLYQIPEEQIAYYNAALKLSEMALIPYAILYTVTAPMYSQLYSERKMDELQLFFTKTTRLTFIIVLPILLVLILCGTFFLGLFGESFREAYPLLLILCLTKLIHVFVGPVNYLMMMVNLEKEATIALLISVFVTIVLHSFLIPIYSALGAAYATLLGLLVFEILICWFTYRKSGISPTIFGRLNKMK